MVPALPWPVMVAVRFASLRAYDMNEIDCRRGEALHVKGKKAVTDGRTDGRGDNLFSGKKLRSDFCGYLKSLVQHADASEKARARPCP